MSDLLERRVLAKTRPCQAKDPATCRYHGEPYLAALNQAYEDMDWDKYEELRADLLAAEEAEEKARFIEQLEADRRKEVFTKKYATLDEKIEACSKELEAGFERLSNIENYEAYLDTMSHYHTYSPNNQMLIYLQNPTAKLVTGYKTWQEKFGRNVKKGEKGILIFAPRIITKDVTLPDGTPVLNDDGTQKKTSYTKFLVVSVFGDNQTEGKELPNMETKTLSETPPAHLAPALEQLITNEGFTVRYAETGTAGGWTDYLKREVVIKKETTPAAQARTLAHELGHIKAKHEDRTDEYHTRTGGCRGEMEMEAESIAYTICRSQGMSTQLSETSSSYIKGWNHTQKDKKLADVMARIGGAVKEILGNDIWNN